MRKTIAFAAGMLALPVFALGAQTRGGLTKVELLALQQEMRDQDCGNKHAAGEWDAATKKAIRTCAKKFNTSTNAKELLAAMSIGFSATDTPPTAGAVKGDDMAGMKMSGEMKAEEAKESPSAEKKEVKHAVAKKAHTAMKEGSKAEEAKESPAAEKAEAKHATMKKKGDMTMKKDSTKKY